MLKKASWLLIKDRKVLFVRSKGVDLSYCIGGKLNVGESHEQALVREVFEEVSVSLLPGTIKYLCTFVAQAHSLPEEISVEIKCYFADYTGSIVAASEIEELQWLTVKDGEKTTETGRVMLTWLAKRGYID